MIRAQLTPLARRELLDATRWIARDNPAAAQGLRQSVMRALERIAAHPDIGTLRPEVIDAPYRFVVLSGFPYVLIYDAARRPPAVIRVLHGARDLESLLKDQ